MLGGFLQKGIFKLFSKINGRIDKDTRELIKNTQKANLSDIDIDTTPIGDTKQHYTVIFNGSQLVPKNEKGKLKGNRKLDILNNTKQDNFANAKVKDKSYIMDFDYVSAEQKVQKRTLEELLKEQGMNAEELNREKDRISLFRDFSVSEILSKDPTKKLQELNDHIGEALEENGKALAMWVGSFKMIMSILPSISMQTLKENGEKVKNFASNFFGYLKTAIKTFREEVWIPIWRQVIPMSRFEQLGGVGQFLANILCRWNSIDHKSDFEQAIEKAQDKQVNKFNEENGTKYQSLEEMKEDLIGDVLVSRDGLPVNSNITYNRTVDGKLRAYENLAEYLQYEGFAQKDYSGKVQRDKNGEVRISNDYIKDVKGKTKTPKLNKPVKWNDLEFATEIPYIDLYKHIHNEIDLFELIRAIADSENDDKTVATVIRYILTQLQSNYILPENYPDLINDNVSVAKINKMARDLFTLRNPEIIGGHGEKVDSEGIYAKSKVKDKTTIRDLNVMDVKNFIRHLGTQVDSVGKGNLNSVTKASVGAKSDIGYLQKIVNARNENKATEQEVVVGETSTEPQIPTSSTQVQPTIPKNDNSNYAKDSGTAKNVVNKIVQEQEEFQKNNPVESTDTTQDNTEIYPQEQAKSENGDVSVSVTTVGSIDNGTKIIDKKLFNDMRDSQSNYENRNGF